ncbi:Coatomer subunit gamma [Mycena indigotica]|uniref:Coatomer subunit gamma n=1 Tax=Mycena indigotica TaxID=2126181 RepID=A0A8H6SE27_9AGAR|nr:Coatomer subunit gamma [Mycena indigotica]KAF7297060.1 Coatomer subunit gamma [Mycena indigotica]
MAFYKKEDESASGLSSYPSNQTTIIQEALAFSEAPISPPQMSSAAYAHRPKDSALRQAVYLAIKELATTTENVIRLPSSIQKDMQPNAEVIYRPNAIRALCHIIDPSMAQGVQRFFKAVIVDRNPSISSASLILVYHMLPQAKGVVKR